MTVDRDDHESRSDVASAADERTDDAGEPAAAAASGTLTYRLATTAAVDVIVGPRALPPSLLLSDGSRATYQGRDRDGALLFVRAAAAGSVGRPVVVDLDPGTSRILAARAASQAQPAVLAAGGPSASFILVDLNGNGVADLVGASPRLRGVSVRSGTAGGRFAPAAFYAIAAHPVVLAVTDLTGDGLFDIVAASRPALSILLGRADGRFEPAIDIDLPIASVDEVASRAPLPIRQTQFHALFAAFLSALATSGDPERDADATLVVAGPATVQSVAGDASAPGPSESLSMGASLRTLADQVIERGLHDPAFSPETLRRTLGVSRSQLYRAFEDDDGVAAAIRDARLDRMHRRLIAQGSEASAPIKTILLDCGFTDAASVSRAFRRRFGLSPRELRSAIPPAARPGPTSVAP